MNFWFMHARPLCPNDVDPALTGTVFLTGTAAVLAFANAAVCALKYTFFKVHCYGETMSVLRTESTDTTRWVVFFVAMGCSYGLDSSKHALDLPPNADRALSLASYVIQALFPPPICSAQLPARSFCCRECEIPSVTCNN